HHLTGAADMDLELRDRTVLITGGSQGIGLATAKVFAEQGCHLVIVARSEELLGQAAREMREQHGVVVEAVCLDLAARGSAERLAARFSSIDILINNAGAVAAGRLEDLSDEKWRAAWELKVFGYIDMCRHFYRVMAARGRGVILNIVGTAAHTKDPGYICGATANAALVAFSQSLGSDSPRDGIRVNALNPGPVSTERRQRFEAYQRESGKVDETPMPFGRIATPEEIAWTVAFLCSPRSAYTSGATISIDGGLSAACAPI
ncbi:short-chain dehydrogenase/reductase, partial [Sphingomonas sp. ZT3P38]|uniref:short-chain dehydrogenase/reductase n=1 Tax=Parasphingomonas zepuensis TaxID=3096161 RepID=UPI002FC99B4A